MSSDRLHPATLRTVASMIVERDKIGIIGGIAGYGPRVAEWLGEWADMAESATPRLSDWIAATEGVGLGAPRIVTEGGAIPRILIYLRGIIVQLHNPIKPPARLYCSGPGTLGEIECHTPASLRALIISLQGKLAAPVPGIDL